MSSASAAPAGEERLALRGGRDVVLHTSGFTLPSGGSQRFTPYRELIHVAVGLRGLRLGLQRGSLFLPRAAFAEPGGALTLAGRLRDRMAALPDGERRLARQAELDRRQLLHVRPVVGLLLALVCVAFHVLASFFPAMVSDGEYWRILGLTREPWRLVTSQLLHGGWPHLAVNSLGLFAIGGLLERQIGAVRTGLVAVASAAGAMIGCAWAGYEQVLGASGIVAGFAGALIALEVRRPDLLPALLRLSRSLLIGAVAADFALLSFVPNVAHAAHGGGIVAGALAALALAPDDPAQFDARPWMKAALSASLALALAALGVYAQGLVDPGAAAARRGARMLDDAHAPIMLLNNDAWTIATSKHPSQHDLELALQLAERAVESTRHEDANLLDTLAEVYFQLGRSEEAVSTIDEAIDLRPGVPYFVEQRRRFLGERAADDRPEPPAEGPGGDEGEDGPPFEPDSDAPPAPGVKV